MTAYQEEAEALDEEEAKNGNAPHIVSNEDDHVVNAAVATIIMPRLRKIALEAYDPFSRSMTSKALHVVEEISYCIETTNPRFQVSGLIGVKAETKNLIKAFLCILQHLIQAFLYRFQTAIHNFQQLIRQAGSAIAHPEISIDMESIQARQRFLQRQLKLLTTGVKWRRYAKNIVLTQSSGPGAGAPFEACLVGELVDRCMLPVIEAAWDTGGKEVAQQVSGNERLASRRLYCSHC